MTDNLPANTIVFPLATVQIISGHDNPLKPNGLGGYRMPGQACLEALSRSLWEAGYNLTAITVSPTRETPQT